LQVGAKKMMSNLSKVHEMHDSNSSFCSQVFLGYFYPFYRNSPLMCSLQPKITKET